MPTARRLRLRFAMSRRTAVRRPLVVLPAVPVAPGDGSPDDAPTAPLARPALTLE
jgi:hypothetical protein